MVVLTMKPGGFWTLGRVQGWRTTFSMHVRPLSQPSRSGHRRLLLPSLSSVVLNMPVTCSRGNLEGRATTDWVRGALLLKAILDFWTEAVLLEPDYK